MPYLLPPYRPESMLSMMRVTRLCIVLLVEGTLQSSRSCCCFRGLLHRHWRGGKTPRDGARCTRLPLRGRMPPAGPFCIPGHAGLLSTQRG